MQGKLIRKDIRKHVFLSAVTTAFMAACAMLLALTVMLFLNLTGAIDSLMEQAKTPDFLQMHAGEADREALRSFAESCPEVECWQICGFLNLENGMLRLGEKTLADSTQDNGLCIQGGSFDFLLDLENAIPEAEEGQIYVPVCYRSEYGIGEGDSVWIGTREFHIAGFIRDSQMNSMMASSKRFLVSETDYQAMKELGSEEWLIEFLLCDGADMEEFQAAYTKAGLPADGPTITKPLLRMMNAISDGMMILVILLVGAVVLLISVLCIRYILLTGLEEDRRKIGLLKALGIPGRDIHKLYFSKYLLLSTVGSAVGLLGALCLYRPLNSGIRELYGTADARAETAAGTVFGILLIEALLLSVIRRLLKRTDKITALAALREGIVQSKRAARQRYLPIALVVTAGVFLMVVPGNLRTTVSSPRFVTYMGIGDGEIRLDVRRTEDIGGVTKQLKTLLEQDGRVAESAAFLTKSFPFETEDGRSGNLTVELGEHDIFPVTYGRGTAPEKEGELALSALQAQELSLDVGDRVTLTIEQRRETFTVCGIYSDITNGGKTAKAAFRETSEAAMWSILYVSLTPDTDREVWTAEWRERCAEKKIAVKISDIAEYVKETYGQTLSQVTLASRVSFGVAAGIIALVTRLFLRLNIGQDRGRIALKKALGFSSRECAGEYVRRVFTAALIGVFAGIAAGCVCGEGICGILLSSLGAEGFRFETKALRLLTLLPAVSMAAVALAAFPVGREIRRIPAGERENG